MSKRLALFYFILWFYLFLIQLYYAFSFLTDDAYISLRYAKHLAEGAGFIWNPGGPHVEGFTNFAWVGFAALILFFHLNAMLILKMISIMALLLSALILYLISRIWLSSPLACLPPLLLLLHRGEMIWTVSGLETATFQCVLLFSVYGLLRAIGVPSKRWLMISSLSLLLASFLRFEAPILLPIYMLMLCLDNVEGKAWQTRMRRVIFFLLPFFFIYLPYYFWRWDYFGRLFPNTVYCKAFMSLAPGFLVLDYLFMISPMMVLSLPKFIFQWDKRFLLLLLPSLIYIVALIQAEVVVGYFHRLFLPAFALLLPLFVMGIAYLYGLMNKRLSPRLQQKASILSVLGLGVLFIPHFIPATHYQRFVSHQQLNMTQRYKVALWLQKQVKKGEAVTLSDCGLIPYVFDGLIVDTYCLNNINMTQSPVDSSYATLVDDILDRQKPRYIILSAVTQGNKAYGAPFDELISRKNQFHLDYRKIKQFMVGDGMNGYLYAVYQRQNQ